MSDDATHHVGRPGASAHAEYVRRRALHDARVRAERPAVLIAGAVGVGMGVWFAGSDMAKLAIFVGVVGLFVLGRLFVVPQHVTAWRAGADGESRTARALDGLGGGFIVVHDRRVPGTKANIDHIVVGPPGVFVVETKSLKGKVSIRGREVYVRGRRATAMVEEVRREALAVRMALGDENADVPIRAVLCIHRAELPFFQHSVSEIAIVSGRELVGRIKKGDRTLGEDRVTRVAGVLEARLPPAVATP